MDLFDAISKRYSHKAAFSREAVSIDHLRRIAEAGMAAPSGTNAESPEFILINDEHVLAEIGKITRHRPLITAPAMIAIVSNFADVLAGVTFYVEDYSAATENILLAATALGYVCGWIDHLLRTPQINDPLCQLLGIPSDRKLMVIIPIGKPGEEASRRVKKTFEQRCSWNHYAVQRSDAQGE
ncbi:MAG: nitroreductase family protein [Anaerolineae bacterium]